MSVDSRCFINVQLTPFVVIGPSGANRRLELSLLGVGDRVHVLKGTHFWGKKSESAKFSLQISQVAPDLVGHLVILIDIRE